MANQSSNEGYTSVNMEDPKDEKPDFKQLLDLLESSEDMTENIRQILNRNPTLLKYISLKSCKYTPLLHIAKYQSNIQAKNKIANIDCIVDTEYRLSTFSIDRKAEDNFLVLFPVAGCGDATTLSNMIMYFRDMDRKWLHDCRNGDTVLHFMIKFGKITHANFNDCFKMLLDEGINTWRKDYYADDLIKVLENEQKYYVKEDMNDRAEALRAIRALIVENQVVPADIVKISLFQRLINNDLEDSLNSGFLVIDEATKAIIINEDDGEHTLLQLAILKKRDDLVRRLLREGSDANRNVSHGNLYQPLVFSVKLSRHSIYRVLLEAPALKIENEHFKVISQKHKFLNDLLHMKHLDVRLDNEGKIPLFYAICQNDNVSIQNILKNGSDLPENCLNIINPKHLEEFFDNCLVGDGYANNIDDYRYKLLIVFDFFLGFDEDKHKGFVSEVDKVKQIAGNNRVKHLIAHPLIQLFMVMKWHCLSSYYYFLVAMKVLLYIIMEATLITNNFNSFLYLVFLTTQIFIVWTHGLRINAHSAVEVLILIIALCMFPLIWLDSVEYLKQTTAVLVISIAVAVFLSLGYHPKLSIWMAMLKRIFRSFATLLLLFMIPISAFSMSFNYLLPVRVGSRNKTMAEEKENEGSDFDTIPTSIFRIFVMLSGDIGDGDYQSFISYLVFLIFAVGMGIVIMNFWTGVAISDIKGIEEQSEVAAIQNVIEYIQSLERTIYLINSVSNKALLINPFVQPHTVSNRKYKATIEIYINNEKNVKQEYFKLVEIDRELVSSIKKIKSKESSENVLTKILEKMDQLEKLLQPKYKKKLGNSKMSK